MSCTRQDKPHIPVTFGTLQLMLGRNNAPLTINASGAATSSAPGTSRCRHGSHGAGLPCHAVLL